MAVILAKPLTMLFQASLDKGRVPQDWQTTTVCPNFKIGERHFTESYRPISTTCVVSEQSDQHQSDQGLCQIKKVAIEKPPWFP